MSYRAALTTCKAGLVPEHYLYFKILSPTAGVAIAAAGLTAGMRPNALTCAGLFLALPIVASNLSGHLLLSCLLLHVFYSIDCADGILARATSQTSRAGAFLDDLAHLVVPPAFFLSLAIWAISTSAQNLAIAAATYTAAELAYRSLIGTLREAPLPGRPAVSPGVRDYRSWLLSSFHLPTVSAFVTAAVLWPTLLTAYLGYAAVCTMLYGAYGASRIAARMNQAG